jgi:methionyl-tRNA formyltransferase
MKIGYFADGVWSHRALDRILQTSWLEVSFIVARFDSPDPLLKEYAEKLKVPYFIHPDVNSPDFIAQIQKYSADLYVSMSFDQIFKTNIIKAAPKGFINCHAGALPFYRGRNVLNWVLINGEKRFGVTVHYVEEGIDTGDIILQRYVDIDSSDDYGSVLNKAVNTCADTLYEALLLTNAGKVQAVKQGSIHPIGFYCGRRRDGDEWLDWNWSSERIHNFVRAITIPGPCARTLLREQEIAVLRTELIPDAPIYIGTPGEVVGRDIKGIVVKTGDSTLRVTRVADLTVDGVIKKAKTPKFPIGTRFGLNHWVVVERMEKRLARLEQILANIGREVCKDIE